ncbi:sensor histidine kinase [Asticcacaulis sp.]|uniref:sensor histidine kinase n=1 Tax=Asticcacaulis sp. TaxID=1872648 RepID=UPI0039190F97
MLEGNPILADKVTTSLADLLRRSLEIDLQTLVPMLEEIENAQRYLMIVKARFGDRFETILDLSSEVTIALIPAMVIQPLIENVVQHGISATSSKVTLTLRARREESRLIIQVLDDAVPDEKPLPQKSTGTGQHNIHQRLKLLYNGEASLTCFPVAGGYESRLSLPWRAISRA